MADNVYKIQLTISEKELESYVGIARFKAEKETDILKTKIEELITLPDSLQAIANMRNQLAIVDSCLDDLSKIMSLWENNNKNAEQPNKQNNSTREFSGTM
jgi:hypothetical protein